MNLYERRCSAYAIDILIIAFAVALFSYFTSFHYVINVVILIATFVLKDAVSRDGSIGKKVMKISIVTVDGAPASLKNRILRNVTMPILFGYERKQIKNNETRLGDRIAKTDVVLKNQ